VAVSHAASIIGCWRRAAGAASLRTAPNARCTPPTHLYQHTITLAAPAAVNPSPLADERLPLGSQSLSVVAALRSAGGLLRRGSKQLKVGLLVLGLAREQQCNAPVWTG